MKEFWKTKTWKSWEDQPGKWRQVDVWWRERGWKQARTAAPLCSPHIYLTQFLWSMISGLLWTLPRFCILGRPVNSSRLWATFSDSSWSHDRRPHLNCQAIKIPSQYQMLSKWSCLQVLWLHTHTATWSCGIISLSKLSWTKKAAVTKQNT